METTPALATHHVPAWLVRLCRRLSTTRGFIGSALLNVVLNLIATWLFTAVDADFSKFPLTRLFDYWYVALASAWCWALSWRLSGPSVNCPSSKRLAPSNGNT